MCVQAARYLIRSSRSSLVFSFGSDYSCVRAACERLSHSAPERRCTAPGATAPRGHGRKSVSICVHPCSLYSFPGFFEFLELGPFYPRRFNCFPFKLLQSTAMLPYTLAVRPWSRLRIGP